MQPASSPVFLDIARNYSVFETNFYFYKKKLKKI